QIREKTIFVRGELDRIAVDRHAAGARIEAHGAAIELALGVASGTPQQRADARQHLLEMEGFGDVVVGAGVKTLNLVAPAVARGQYEDRHGPAGAAPGLEHRDAVHLRQTDVENDRIVGLALAEEMAFFAVERAIDHVACVDERGRKLPVEIGIVLDDEEAQAQGSTDAARAVSSMRNRRLVTVPLHKNGGKAEEGRWRGPRLGAPAHTYRGYSNRRLSELRPLPAALRKQIRSAGAFRLKGSSIRGVSKIFLSLRPSTSE